ncbi:predicted protein [Arabidopsis lyrata subsp. lyrata]|uniref:Predicted protein n=1 Tax=Arabidopsis lyrata subsp. lyrata TaxID=81972 RepID=D7LNK6_ARALL|nr:predicted protein [Arabidopsis lyrata subsp. lyrata]
MLKTRLRLVYWRSPIRPPTLRSRHLKLPESTGDVPPVEEEAAIQLWRNMTLPGVQAFLDSDELIFNEEYKKFARSSFETNALANDLIAQYERKLKLKYTDRTHFRLLSSVFKREKSDHEKLRKKYAILEAGSNIHSAEVASLKDEIVRLGRRVFLFSLEKKEGRIKSPFLKRDSALWV